MPTLPGEYIGLTGTQRDSAVSRCANWLRLFFWTIRHPSALSVVLYYETLITFLLATAARRSEALGLTPPNINFDAASGYLPDTKNGRARSLVLRKHVIDGLKRLPRDGARVFPMSVNEVRSAWYRICDRAKLEDFHMHDLRHCALSELCETARRAGVPFAVHELAAVTGHRDLRSLARYLNLCAGELAQRIDEAYQMAAHRLSLEDQPLKDQRNPWLHRGRAGPRIHVSLGATQQPTPEHPIEPTSASDGSALHRSIPTNKLPA